MEQTLLLGDITTKILAGDMKIGAMYINAVGDFVVGHIGLDSECHCNF